MERGLRRNGQRSSLPIKDRQSILECLSDAWRPADHRVPKFADRKWCCTAGELQGKTADCWVVCHWIERAVWGS